MNMREQVIQLVLNIPDGMRIGVYVDDIFVPVCTDHSDIESVINENGQHEAAFVIRPCLCNRNDLPISKKIDKEKLN